MFVTTALRPQKYFAEFAYLCHTRMPVDSGPGEIVGIQRCGEGCGGDGVSRSVIRMDWLRDCREGVSMLIKMVYSSYKYQHVA